MIVFLAREFGCTPKQVMCDTLPRQLNEFFNSTFKLKYQDKLDDLLLTSGSPETKEDLRIRWFDIVRPETEDEKADESLVALGSLFGQQDIGRKIVNRRAAQGFLEAQNG